MDIVKKNLLSIICGVVALAARGVAFTMLPTKASELTTEMESRKKAYDDLHQLVSKERQLPSVNPDNPEQQRLPVFPSEKINKWGEEVTAQVKKESEDLRDTAAKMNEHKLLVPGSLPAPSNPAAISFVKAYQAALPLPTAPGGVLNSRFAKELKAGMPPNAEDVRKKLEDAAVEIRKSKSMINATGQVVNQQAVDAEVAELASSLPKKLLEEVSKNSRVYINPDTFELYQKISSAVGSPDPVDIYFAQLSYWIQQDVVNAINDANGQSKSIAESPVKFLVAVRLQPVQGGPAFVTATDLQATGDPDGTIRKETIVSPTGRVSNGLFDVFHFTVVAEVEAAKVGEFLRALGNNRFITPLWVDVKTVDNATALAQGHFYGDKPMLNVTAQCELLYLRSWNTKLMPALVAKRLGITTDQPGATPAAAPAAAAGAPAGNGP